MTAAERQKKRRRKLQKEQGAERSRKERLKARQKAAEDYVPMPPGITYWRRTLVVKADGTRGPGVPPEGDVYMLQPETRPLAACESDLLDDDDIRALLYRLRALAHERGIDADPASLAEWRKRREDAEHGSDPPSDTVTLGPWDVRA